MKIVFVHLTWYEFYKDPSFTFADKKRPFLIKYTNFLASDHKDSSGTTKPIRTKDHHLYLQLFF